MTVRVGELAVSVESRSIYANPDQVVDPGSTALILSGLLGLDFDRLREKLISDGTFVFVARQVEPDEAAEVESLELPGIHFLTEPKRVYPSGSLAAHAVGFVNIDSKGIEGLEAQYDGLLTGTPGRVLAERAPGGQVIPHGRHEVQPAVPGADLIISIDREIQFMAHRACVDTLLSADAERCTVVALDPDTFEVLAMVVVPSFDPSNRSQAGNRRRGSHQHSGALPVRAGIHPEGGYGVGRVGGTCGGMGYPIPGTGQN